MQLKKEFFELSKYFNKGTNEDKLLFIGMFLNFYLTENNFKNQEEIEENLKVYFKTDKTPIEIVTEVINGQELELNYFLNKLFLVMTNKKEKKSINEYKNSWSYFLENL
ncbi:hypothetical protein KST25_02665 [Fusobacterium vincentii]|uniref:Uncharacterized protein n=2 Tax=Fusobacterium TaxID=848 RepID=F9EMT5_9FUSO|nr:hypothetical protein [Fusobacterium nucleatum]EGQ79734.1 hypothetical protein HMPREF9094_1240 [Fusobacterium animalis ATCC 51191]KXA24023.1 hypothetical protein HMPREF3221_00621 [Fusobacterium nucleatum]MCL4582099.1 hypothetical protein [Fusobacterium nucleatum YWH7054]MCL4593254.1 hypothetical protein [Fusobacterium nucleatum YWH7053]